MMTVYNFQCLVDIFLVIQFLHPTNIYRSSKKSCQFVKLFIICFQATIFTSYTLRNETDVSLLFYAPNQKPLSR